MERQGPQKSQILTSILIAVMFAAFSSPSLADSSADVADLIQLIKTSKTKVLQSNQCDQGRAGYYEYPTEDGKGDTLVVCANNINIKDMSALWEVIAHESTHVMQACNGGTIWKDEYHPRMLRNLKEQAPHYALILEDYRGEEKMLELEAFNMELKSPAEVKQLFQEYCLSSRRPPRSTANPEEDNLSNLTGGREAFRELLAWASNNLSKEELKELAAILESKNREWIAQAIRSLQERYRQSQNLEEYRLF